MFSPQRDEVMGMEKLHELNDLYCLLNIVQVIKLRTLGWEVHVACMGERISVYRV